MQIPRRLAQLSDYELAALFHEEATRRCTSHAEADARALEIDLLNAVLDARGVQLEDWSLTRQQDRGW